MSCPFLQTIPNQIADINKELNTTEEEVNDIIELLKTWIKQQPHLPKEDGEDFDRRLKCMLRCNKLSLEKTKMKIDMSYTVRNLFPEFFDNREPLHPRIQQAMETYTFVPISSPMDSLTRLHFFRLEDDALEKFDLDDFAALSLNMLDFRAYYDLCTSEFYIFDYDKYTMSHILKINLAVIKKFNFIFEKAYSDRIVGMHFLNMPNYGQIAVNIVKSVMKEKIANRIHVHPNLESLHQQVPKRLLPSDYGGEEKPLSELKKNWYKYLEDNNSWFLKQNSYRSNEKLRPGKPILNELFGVEGSFRKLNID